MNRPELTTYEQELLGDPVHCRGYTPDDDLPEPTEGPSEPARTSGTVGEKVHSDLSPMSCWPPCGARPLKAAVTAFPATVLPDISAGEVGS
jgi:hypothetical protein